MASDVRSQGSLIGSSLGGYHVEALVGRGAMGSVYLARDTKLNRHVALKVLLGSLARTPSIVKQFHQEAQSAAPLNHPNIVRIYSAGMEDGTPYIAMEFVDGEPLDRFLKRKGKVGWEVALHIGAQVALALDCAHQHGIVHRDVKPSNILVDRKGSVRLTDFGIARMQSGGSVASGPVVGTPQYMSPEQVTGGEVGASSDLFALGVTLYQMISGEMPFRGESSMALINSICEDEPPRLNRLDPNVPDDVARLVAYLIEKDPASRPASAKVTYGLIHRLQRHRGGASAVAESLTAFLKEEMEARPFSSLEKKEAQSRKKSSKVRRRLKRGRFGFAVAAHVTAIAVLGAAAFAYGPLSAARDRERPPRSAEALDLSLVQPVQPNVRRMNIMAGGHAIADLAWLPGEGALIVRTIGRSGTVAAGATGMLALDSAVGTLTSLAAPKFARGANGPPGVRPLDSWFVPPSAWDSTNPLAGSVPAFAANGGLDAVLLSQPWRARTPRVEILASVPLDSLRPANNAAIRVVVHPTEPRVCLVLRDSDADKYYLAEKSLGSPSDSSPGERRTAPSANVVPESVQYVPGGERLAYLRRTPAGDAELLLLRSGSADLDGRRLANGLFPGAISISPSGDWAAVMIGSDGAIPEIAIVDMNTGAISARFGPGSLQPQAWLSDSSGFFFLSPEPGSSLVFASLEKPDETATVLRLTGGLGPAYAVSPDSGEIAAADPKGDAPAVYLINSSIVR